jgi:hypothetical protein
VTPKLLPNLHFTRRVRTFNVCNGPTCVSQSKWDVKRFIKLAMAGAVEEMNKKRRKKQRIEEEEARAMEGIQEEEE